ncbi:MAG TPA: hypothetical protein VE961_03155 [Pyrinomonadaceae bacterium]|nr:hypothetical protein [Pyrinomonadaceae bacterium]
MTYRCLFALSLLLASTAVALAQPADAGKTGNSAKLARNTKDPEAERILKERRDNAQALLISLAADAGRFNDQTLRARTQARIADVLWSADPERARALFRKAWESAEVVDQESQRKLQEDFKQQAARNGGGGVVRQPPNIRNEVLRLASKHDRALGEEFLGKFKTQQQQDATAESDRLRNNPGQAPEALAQRLTLARQLLDTDVARALQFADPALSSLTIDAVDFLSYLRDKDAAAADMRYGSFLVRASADLQSDANTVSLLASYLFTPHIFVTFNNSGSSSTRTSRDGVPPNISPELRNAFFRTAADILLRPLAPPGQDQTTAGVQGKFLMLKRLEPLFDQYAPRELADAIHAQADALAQGLPDDVRQRDDGPLREGIRPPMDNKDQVKNLQDRIDQAKTSEERDRLYVQMAQLYVDQGSIQARDYVDKIDDTELRNKVRPFIDGTLMLRANDKKDTDLLFEVLKKGDLSHFQRSWGLMRAATLLTKTDRELALGTIEEATAEARRIDASDPDRPRAMIAIANALLTLDRAKSWETVEEAIRAANGAESFTGEDGTMRISLITKNSSSIHSTSSGEFNVAGVFTELAKQDYNKSIEVIRGFEHEAPRASATIAIARTVLEEKKN